MNDPMTLDETIAKLAYAPSDWMRSNRTEASALHWLTALKAQVDAADDIYEQLGASAIERDRLAEQLSAAQLHAQQRGEVVLKQERKMGRLAEQNRKLREVLGNLFNFANPRSEEHEAACEMAESLLAETEPGDG